MLQGHLGAPPQPSVSRLVRVSSFQSVPEVCLLRLPGAVSKKIALSGLCRQLHCWPAAAVVVVVPQLLVVAVGVRFQIVVCAVCTLPSGCSHEHRCGTRGNPEFSRTPAKTVSVCVRVPSHLVGRAALVEMDGLVPFRLVHLCV